MSLLSEDPIITIPLRELVSIRAVGAGGICSNTAAAHVGDIQVFRDTQFDDLKEIIMDVLRTECEEYSRLWHEPIETFDVRFEKILFETNQHRVYAAVNGRTWIKITIRFYPQNEY